MGVLVTIPKITGPKLQAMATRKNGMVFMEAFKKAQAENRIMTSNKRMDAALVGSNEWRGVNEALACHTGTLTGYEEPGRKFGKEIVYTDFETKERWVFPVPSQYRGERNAILVCEHPDYVLMADGKDVVIAASVIGVIANFPKEEGWYFTDVKFGIPIGASADPSNAEARKLWRSNYAEITPVVRDHSGVCGDYSRSVYLCFGTSTGFGAVVQAPEHAPLLRFG